MRKPLLFVALSALFLGPNLASYAGPDAGSEGMSQANRYAQVTSTSSAGFSETRMAEDILPVAKDANFGTPAVVNPTKTTVSAPNVVGSGGSSSSGTVNNYVWTK